jgi:S1-C subfamily serine protease
MTKINLWELTTETILPLKSFVKLNSYAKVATEEAEEGLIGFSSASGFWIAENKVVTAAHFCETITIKMMLMKRLIFFERIFFEIETFDGNKREAIITKVDDNNDLCMLMVIGPTDNISKQILKISDHKPYHGERIYNLAEPLGIFTTGMLPVFEGFYSGPSSYPDIGKGIKVDMYSLPIKQGSSGSPILNDKGELIGVVIAGVKGFENLGFSPSYDVVRQFINE